MSPTLDPFARPTCRAALAALLLALVACGGGQDAEQTDPTRSGQAGGAAALKGGDSGGGGTCSGSCTGGGGTPVPGATNPLPTSAPAADIVYRESFGPGPADLRPKGGKGDMRSTFIGTTLGGFWVEWPGSKGNAWITNSGEATWKFTSSSNGGPNPNPYEMPSPLEVDLGYGVIAGQVFSDVSDGTTGGFPTALLPMSWPTTAWSMSIEGVLWGGNAPSYIALGVTDSSTTLSNLVGPARLTLLMRPVNNFQTVVWELWTGGASRTLVASGPVEDLGFNQLKLSYDPVAKVVSVYTNEQLGGTFPMDLGRPRYAAFEGHGLVDNFVVRKATAATP